MGAAPQVASKSPQSSRCKIKKKKQTRVAPQSSPGVFLPPSFFPPSLPPSPSPFLPFCLFLLFLFWHMAPLPFKHQQKQRESLQCRPATGCGHLGYRPCPLRMQWTKNGISWPRRARAEESLHRKQRRRTLTFFTTPATLLRDQSRRWHSCRAGAPPPAEGLPAGVSLGEGRGYPQSVDTR